MEYIAICLFPYLINCEPHFKENIGDVPKLIQDIEFPNTQFRNITRTSI